MISSIEEVGNDVETPSPTPKLSKLKEFRLRIPSLDKIMMNQPSPTPRVFDFLKARPSRSWFRKFRLSSPLAVFRRTVDKHEQISLVVPSPAGIRRRFHIQFFRKINWRSVFSECKEWLRHPMNLALVLWLLCVAVVGAFLGLLLLGFLNHTLPSKSLRNYWIEICNQLLNALFTLMSIFQHPILFHHLFMLCRWNSEDIVALRKIYCKDGAYRPHEWAHMLLVVLLLHFTCIAQYALCTLYWGYSSKKRSEFLEDLFFALGIAAPIFAGAYTVYSPLGREYDLVSDEKSEDSQQPNKTGPNLYDRRVVVSKPEWVGGLFDCSDDTTVGYLSFFCTFCVFGWNMERLGFGNMYVHMFTFLLLCIAPFWIFSTTALKIHNVLIDDVMWIVGIVLCVCGLLYGGFWRTEMRKRFKLPGNTFCCGSASLTDYFQWMFCWSCSLAQEVRTGNFYDIEDDSLYRKLVNGNQENLPDSDCNATDDCEYEIVISVSDNEPSGLAGAGANANAMIPPIQAYILSEADMIPIQLDDDDTIQIQLDDGVSEADTIQIHEENHSSSSQALNIRS